MTFLWNTLRSGTAPNWASSINNHYKDVLLLLRSRLLGMGDPWTFFTSQREQKSQRVSSVGAGGSITIFKWNGARRFLSRFLPLQTGIIHWVSDKSKHFIRLTCWWLCWWGCKRPQRSRLVGQSAGNLEKSTAITQCAQSSRKCVLQIDFQSPKKWYLPKIFTGFYVNSTSQELNAKNHLATPQRRILFRRESAD